MKTALTQQNEQTENSFLHAAEPFAAEPIKMFSVVGIYSDFNSATEIMPNFHRINDAIGKTHLLDLNLWRLDLLEAPRIQNEAHEYLIKADIILFALARNCDCSPALRIWFEELPTINPHRRALVVLHTRAKSKTSRVPSDFTLFLKELARRKGMDFLSNECPIEGPAPTSPDQAEADPAETTTLIEMHSWLAEFEQTAGHDFDPLRDH